METGKLQEDVAKNTYETFSEEESKEGRNQERSLEELYQDLGFGKVQYLLWSLVVIVPIASVSFLMLTTILMPYLRCEWHLGVPFETAIGSIMPLGYTVGGLLFGNLADKYGRRKILLVTSCLLLFGSVLLAVSPNKWVFLTARFFQGVSIGTGYHVSYVFVAETASSEYKEAACLAMGLGSKVGAIFLSLISYLLLNTVGWRYLIGTLLGPLVVVILGLFLIPETPRYLVTSGRPKDALQTVTLFYKWNGKTFPGGCTAVKQCTVEKRGEFGGLFRNGFARPTILLSVISFANVYTFYGFAAYVPLAAEGGRSVRQQCSQSLDQTALLEIAISFLGDMAGCGIAALVAKKIGRVFGLRGCAILALLPSTSLYFSLSQVQKNIMNFLLRFCVSGLRIILWLVIVEVYPTAIRSTASGFAASLSELGGLLGNMLTYWLYSSSSVAVVSLFVGAAGLQLLSVLLWNVETKSNRISDKTEE